MIHDDLEGVEIFDSSLHTQEKLMWGSITIYFVRNGEVDKNESIKLDNATTDFYCNKYREYFCDISNVDDQLPVKVIARTSKNQFVGNMSIRVDTKLQKIYTVEIVCK